MIILVTLNWGNEPMNRMQSGVGSNIRAKPHPKLVSEVQGEFQMLSQTSVRTCKDILQSCNQNVPTESAEDEWIVGFKNLNLKNNSILI